MVLETVGPSRNDAEKLCTWLDRLEDLVETGESSPLAWERRGSEFLRILQEHLNRIALVDTH